MDDAQQIVLVALQQAGVTVPVEVEEGQELGCSALVSICSQAVALLRGSASSPSIVLPEGTAERFRVCTDLAAAIKLLGYQGDLSFHQFLYPSHADTHRLLRFLLDQLSRTSTEGPRTRKDRSAPPKLDKLSATVQQALIKAHGHSHTAEEREGDNELPFRTSPLHLTILKTVGGAVHKKHTLVTLQANPRTWLIPSLLELNAKNVISSSGLGYLAKQKETETSGTSKVITHGEFLPEDGGQIFSALDRANLFGQYGDLHEGEGGEEVGMKEGTKGKSTSAQLQEQLLELCREADKMEAEAEEITQHTLVLKEQQEAGAHETQKGEKEVAVMQDAVNLALDPSTSPSDALQQLQAQVMASEKHLASLQAEWGAVRQPLEGKRAELERDALRGKGELQEKMKKIKDLRQQLKQTTSKLRLREEQAWTMEAEVMQTGSAAKRSSYVHRITELIKNSQKQEKDIAKIIADTRELQRDSNIVNDRLRRTHALVDELVFRDAKKDAVCRQAYRQLSTIHESFADIVDKVMAMDKTGREIAELQAQLEELQKSSLDVTSVQSDLDKVVAENRTLEKRLAEVLTMQQTVQ